MWLFYLPCQSSIILQRIVFNDSKILPFRINGSFFYLQINIGTIHPSTHGLLRIIAFHNTEIIKWCQSEIGFLHRGAERLIEYRSYNQSIPYFDRFDYVAFLAQEEIYCFANEKLLNCWISKYSSVIRTIFCEITRILNGVLAITTHAIDIGTFTPFL